MTHKEKDAIFIFDNCTESNCVKMIKKYSPSSLPDKKHPNYYEYSYKRMLQETICDIFENEIVLHNLNFKVFWN